jgi:DNA polymerase elongation subunit (family B)
MYQNIYFDRRTQTAHIWDDVGGYQTTKFQNYAFRKRPGGRYRSIYGDELERVTYFNPKDPSLFGSDIPIETKILIDLYESSDDVSTGHRIGCIDIETDSEGGFPSVELGDKEITAIALYDYVQNKYTAFLLDKENKVQSSSIDGVEIIVSNNEYNLLSKFLNKWNELGFTIITGWNTSGFDLPYLYNRITNVMGNKEAKRISPIDICYINDWSKQLIIAGISSLDYMQLFTKYMDKKEPSYALDAISKKHIGIGKIEFEGSLNHLYKTDIKKYIEYNIHDVKLVVELDKKYKYIELARKICHTGHVPYESFAWSSRYIEGAILTYLRRNGGLIAPNKPIEGREEYELQLESNQEGFDGAYVKEPVLGKHKFVYDLDLTSMYPKIIISLNISPETKIGKVDNWDSEKYLTGELTKLFIAGNEYSKEEFEKLLNEQNLSISSNGVLYSLKKKGIIPSILSKWFTERVEMRKLEKKYGQENNTEMYNFYNQRQLVQKIMLNSVYGVLGLPLFRFYDKDNAEAVTTSGVTIIQTAGKAINMYYNNILNDNKDYVIYTDTDSCFASAIPLIEKLHPNIDKKNETEMIKETLNICSKVQKYVNDMFNVMAKKLFNLNYHEFEAKQEVIARSSFWLAKKKYTQAIINKNGIECDEIEIKGIDVVRTNFPIGFKKFMNEFLRDLLKDTLKEDIDKKIYDFERSLCNIPVIELAKNTSIKFISQDKKKNYNPDDRVPFNYVLGTPAQVKAGLAYNDLLSFWGLDKKNPKLMNGQKIKWVYLLENDYGIDALAMKADGTDPKEIMDFIEKYIDRNQLYTQELKSKLTLFYNVQHWIYPTEASMNTAVVFTDF